LIPDLHHPKVSNRSSTPASGRGFLLAMHDQLLQFPLKEELNEKQKNKRIVTQ